jgi:hypothetical protein
MSIKDNLEKAAAIFGATNEPKCVFMDKATKDKIVSEELEKQMHEAIADMFERNTPVAKKPFDISEHEFSDEEIRFVKVFHKEKYITTLLNKGAFNTVRHDKGDVIAMAKALGVTGEDLL